MTAAGGLPWARRAGTALLVIALIAIGVAIGAGLWPRAVTIERRVVNPIRDVGRRAGLPETLPDLVEAACPAIIAIELPPASARPAGRRAGTAAPLARDGFFVAANGFLVTSARGLPDAGVKARLDDGRVLTAEVRAIDPVAGLALLKVEGSDFATLDFADDDYPRLGAAGFVPAAPAGQGCIVQSALVSSDFVAERATARAYLRLRPAPDPAAEGAPFLDADGAVAGIALPTARANGLDAATFLPGDLASKVVAELMRAGATPARPFGIVAEDLTPVLAARLGSDRRGGAMVAIVAPGSAADRAGLRAGDVVLAAGGAPISGATELARTLGGPGRPVALDIMRGGEAGTVTLVR